MTHAWQQTIQIDEKIAQTLIKTQFNFKIDRIILFDQGWDNLVYLINQKIIFRFPRREISVACMENEITLLPIIAKHVSFSLSQPQWIGKPSALYPYPFSGYKMLAGKALCDAVSSLIDDANFAKTLARWLKELHTIPITESNLKGEQQWRLDIPNRIAKCKENLTHYESYFLQAGFDKKILLKIIESFHQLNFSHQKKSYLHGDLYSKHILVDPKNLLPTGIIDWGDIHIGHPGIDLEIGMIFTKKNLNIFLEAYEMIDNETINIMLFRSFCHSMSFLPYAYEQNKPALKNWAAITLNRVIDELNV